MPDRPASDPPPQPIGPLTDKQIATYIAEMAAEMRQYAKRPRLRTVHYLLDMVRLEAEKTAKELPDTDPKPPPPTPARP